MNVFGQLLHVEDFQWDAVHYRIAVFRVTGGTHGRWSCDSCTVEDDQDTTHPSVEESLRVVKRSIERHHQAHHAVALDAQPISQALDPECRRAPGQP